MTDLEQVKVAIAEWLATSQNQCYCVTEEQANYSMGKEAAYEAVLELVENLEKEKYNV